MAGCPGFRLRSNAQRQLPALFIVNDAARGVGADAVPGRVAEAFAVDEEIVVAAPEPAGAAKPGLNDFEWVSRIENIGK